MGYYLRTQGIHPLPSIHDPKRLGPVNVGPAGYISLKELDENASKVLLGFRRWAIAECRGLRRLKKKKVDGLGGVSMGIR